MSVVYVYVASLCACAHVCMCRHTCVCVCWSECCPHIYTQVTTHLSFTSHDQSAVHTSTHRWPLTCPSPLMTRVLSTCLHTGDHSPVLHLSWPECCPHIYTQVTTHLSFTSHDQSVVHTSTHGRPLREQPLTFLPASSHWLRWTHSVWRRFHQRSPVSEHFHHSAFLRHHKKQRNKKRCFETAHCLTELWNHGVSISLIRALWAHYLLQVQTACPAWETTIFVFTQHKMYLFSTGTPYLYTTHTKCMSLVQAKLMTQQTTIKC